MSNPQELTEKLLEEMKHQHGVLACYPWMTEGDSTEYARQNIESTKIQQIMNDQINMQNETIEHRSLTVEQRIAQAVLEERERCASIAEEGCESCSCGCGGEIAVRIRSKK